MTQVQDLVNGLENAFDEFKKNQEARDKEIFERQDNLELQVNRAGLGGIPNTSEGSSKANILNQKLLPYFRSGDDSQIKNEMSVGSGPDGGYTQINELEKIIHEVARDISPVYDLARKETCTTSEFEVLTNTDLAGVEWVNETDARNATATPTLKKTVIPVHEQSCLQEVTQKLVDDSAFDVENFVRSNVATSKAAAANAAFISGDGVSKPYGILSYDVSTDDDDVRAWETIQYVTSGSDGDFGNYGDCLFDAVYKMRAPYLSNAAWLMSRSTAAAVRKLKDGQSRFLWQDGLAPGQPNTLLGYPVRLCEDMPAISTDSFSIMFANLQSAYCVPERPGIRFLRDPYTNKPYLRLYFTRRIGGAVTDFNAIKLIKFST